MSSKQSENDSSGPEHRDTAPTDRRKRWAGRLGGMGWRSGKGRYDRAKTLKAAGENARKYVAAAMATVATGVAGAGYVTAADARDQVSEVTTQLEGSIGAADTVSDTLDSLGTQLDDLASAQDTLADAIREGDEDTAALAAERVTALSEHVDSLVADLDAQVTTLTVRADDTDQLTAELRGRLDALTTDLDDTAAQLSGLSERIEEVAADLGERLDTLAARVEETSDRLDATYDELAAVQDALAELTGRVERLEQRPVPSLHAAQFPALGELVDVPAVLGTLRPEITSPGRYLVAATVQYTQHGGCRIDVTLTVDGTGIRRTQSEGTVPVAGGSIAAMATVELDPGVREISLGVDGCADAEIGESVLIAARSINDEGA